MHGVILRLSRYFDRFEPNGILVGVCRSHGMAISSHHADPAHYPVRSRPTVHFDILVDEADELPDLCVLLRDARIGQA